MDSPLEERRLCELSEDRIHDNTKCHLLFLYVADYSTIQYNFDTAQPMTKTEESWIPLQY